MNNEKETQHKWTTQSFIISSFIVIIPFILLAVASFYDWGMIGELDNQIGNEFHEERRQALTYFFIFITRLGDGWFVTLLTIGIGGYFWFVKQKLTIGLWYACTVGIGMGIINPLVKALFARPRPDEALHLIQQGGYSFPSGHAMGSLITYGALLFLVIRLMKTSVTKWIVTGLLISLIALIGISRVYLGVHYPSDIIGGYSLGASWLALTIGLYGLSVILPDV